MPQAVNRIYQALFSGEKIAVYGDFDADGITATALLVQGLSGLGGRVVPYIPHRLHEGYGLKLAALERLHKQGVRLVVTVDCGTTNFEEVRQAKNLGMDIIITDHHLPTTSLPPAVAVVNPKRGDSTYPTPGLAGVGVAFKLFQAVLYKSGREESLTELMDLVALGTVADMSPLIGENRYLVKQGLKVLNDAPRLGLQEIINCAGLTPSELDAETISWTLGPRLNAAGRLGYATNSYQLLLTQSKHEASALAQELERENAQRQKLTSEVLTRARENIIAAGTDQPLLITGDKNFFPGVVGIAAGRLADEFYRPVFLLRLGSELCHGSARSIPEFDIIAALKQCRDLLTKFGGHAMAAGFTLSTKNLASFKQRLLSLATEQLAGLDLRPHLDIDAEVPLSSLSGETFNLVQQMAPFGKANPLPNFLTRHVEVVECRNLGNKDAHLGLKLRQENITWPAIGFNLGNFSSELTPYIDIAYNLKRDQWGGNKVLRINLLDFAPSD